MRRVHVSKEEKDRRFRGASRLIDEILEEPDRFPEKAVIFLWSDEELSRVFTKERLRLLRKVKENTYESISELAEALDRDVSLVRKDLKLLEEYGLVTLERYGARVRIYSDKVGIYVPLVEAKPVEEYAKGALLK